MAGISVTRMELAAGESRRASGKTKGVGASRRMLAIALVPEGADRAAAAETRGMDRQTLRDWVHRYDAAGLDGLENRKVPHRRRRRMPEESAALSAWVEAGPGPGRDGVGRGRRKDLQARIAAGFGVTPHERSAGKPLAALGFRRLSVRPRHPRPDPEVQTAFKKTSAKRERQRSPKPRAASRWRSGSRTKRASASRAP